MCVYDYRDIKRIIFVWVVFMSDRNAALVVADVHSGHLSFFLLYIGLFAPSFSLFFISCVLDFLFFFLSFGFLICLYLAILTSFFFILFSLFLFFLHASLLLSPFTYFSFCYVFVRTFMLMNQKNKSL